jgi:hypothetical protein
MEDKTIFKWAEIFQEQIQNGASQSDIIQMLEEYTSQALHMHDFVGRSEQLLKEQSDWLMANTSLEVKTIVDFKEHFK